MEMPKPDPDVLALKPVLVKKLQEVLPQDAVIHEEAETRAYECDALTAYRCPPLAAVLPRNTEEVAAGSEDLPRHECACGATRGGHLIGGRIPAHGGFGDPGRGADE